MSRLETALREIAGHLERRQRRWAVVGGLAVSARSEPRFTRDVDLALVVADDSDAESLVRDLAGSGYHVIASLEQEAVRRLATVRLQSPGERVEGIVVDLLFASSGVESEVVEAAEVLEVLPSLPVPVARIGDLLALKVLSSAPERPQDDVDIAALLRVAEAPDVQRAEHLAALIVERGYGRGRDLVARLRQHLPSRG